MNINKQKFTIMLNISKHFLHLTSIYTQNTCQASTRNRLPKTNKIKKLMREYKGVFGVLVETSAQKKRRLKLERKGKIPSLKTNEINTELTWVKNSNTYFRKIIFKDDISAKIQNKDDCTSESESGSCQIKRTDAISATDESHTNNNLTSNKIRTNPIKFARQFRQVLLKIKKPTDENAKTIPQSKSNQVTQEVKITNPTSNSSMVVIDSNYNKAASTAECSHLNQTTVAESSNFQNNKQLINSRASDIENVVSKSNIPFASKSLPSIVVKNLHSFPIMGNKSKKESSVSTEILSIFGKDDPDTVKYPSVTRILMDTMSTISKLALEAWKENMIKKLGQEGFDVYQKALLEDGKSLHSCIAHSLLGKEYTIPDRMEPVFKSVQNVLGDVHHVKAVETHVAHTKLYYKGIVDCVASYRGENYVIDWKKSDKKKLSLKETYDAPIQIAAYIGAINSSNLYPFMITRGLLVIAYTCGAPAAVYEIHDNTLRQYWIAWLRRLQRYYIETASDDDNKLIR